MVNNFFSIKRFFGLIKCDLIMNRQTILVAASTILGALLLFNFIAPHNIHQIDAHPTGFLLLLFGGGIWMANRTFRRVHDKQRNYFFLTFPCSNFEKFLAPFFLASIGYALALLVLYTLFYWFIASLGYLFFHESFFISTPFLPQTWHMIWVYLVIQSVFMLGSVYFKKSPFLKATLTISLIGTVLFLFIALVAKMFLQNQFESNMLWIPNIETVSMTGFTLVRFGFWIVLAPFCWVITYYRLKEIEG